MKKISIVIPAFNEEKYLARCLRSLAKQTFSRNDFEIIVVDNNSQDKTSEIAQKGGADIITKEGRQGTNFARQKGAEVAQAEILAFIDADSIPPVDWVEKIYKFFKQAKHKEIGILSGSSKYDVGRLMAKLAQFSADKAYPAYVRLLEEVFDKRGAIAIGANMAVRKKVLNDIGGFNTKLVFWGDDADTAIRITRSGYGAVYRPDFRVASSWRRFERDGVILTNLRYMWAYAKVFLKEEHREGVKE